MSDKDKQADRNKILEKLAELERQMQSAQKMKKADMESHRDRIKDLKGEITETVAALDELEKV